MQKTLPKLGRCAVQTAVVLLGHRQSARSPKPLPPLNSFVMFIQLSLQTDRARACSIARTAACPCEDAYWTVIASGGLCCHTSNLGCARINAPHYYGSANWGQWEAWSSCSASCGTGARSRRRRCEGDCSTGSCSPVGAYNTQSQSCSAGTPRLWSAWSGWSSCGCGDVLQRRSRSCQGNCGSCSGSGSESRNCQHSTVRSWTNWGSWGGCGTRCGVSTRRRSRSCVGDCGSCAGVSTDSKSCSSGSPRAYTAWSSWGACSAACGEGIAQRSRSCEGCYGGCSGDSLESRACIENVPASWTTWSDWAKCSSDCGPGTRQRRRTCTGDCEGSCPLSATEDDSSGCETATPRTWASWSPWGACEGCGTGSRSRTRTCQGTCEGSCEAGAVEPLSEPCPADVPAAWSSWSSFSACSAVCGDGLQTRTRTCEGEPGGREMGSKDDVLVSPMRKYVFLYDWPFADFCLLLSRAGECEGSCPEIGRAETSKKACRASALAVPGPWSDWGEHEYRHDMAAASGRCSMKLRVIEE
jgi:hypothetical protein